MRLLQHCINSFNNKMSLNYCHEVWEQYLKWIQYVIFHKEMFRQHWMLKNQIGIQWNLEMWTHWNQVKGVHIRGVHISEVFS